MAFAAGNCITNVGAPAIAKRMVGATPTQAEIKYCEFGTGATTAGGVGRTAAVTDTALTTSITAARATGTVSNVNGTLTNDTFQIAVTLTNPSGTSVIDEFGVHGDAAYGSLCISVTHGAQSLGAGDSIAYTVKIRFAAVGP